MIKHGKHDDRQDLFEKLELWRRFYFSFGEEELRKRLRLTDWQVEYFRRVDADSARERQIIGV